MGRMLLTGCFIAAGFLSGAPTADTATESTVPAHTVTGTLTMLDLSAGKGMLKTDLGKPIFFDVARPEQFARLSIGDRVTMQLDEAGRTVKVIEAMPAEVHEPPPPPPAP